MSAPGDGRRGSVEVAPLSHRVAAMSGYRVAEIVVLTVLALVQGHIDPVQDGVITGAYVLTTGLFSACIVVRRPGVAVRAFGLALLVDGVFLQYVHERLGHQVAVDVVLAAQLVAVCLLASFRTGLKLAVWQSVLMLVAWKSEQAHLVPAPSALIGLDREHAIVTDMALLWLVVVTTSTAASINERELRRRRYDAESLERLSAALLLDERPEAVLRRLVDFVVGELSARRAVVLRRTAEPSAVTLLAASGAVVFHDTPHLLGAAAVDQVPAQRHGPDPAGPAAGPVDRPAPSDLPVPSGLLDLVASATRPVLALRLDPARDPFLSALMPAARRVGAIPLGATDQNGVSTVLVAEFGSGRGSRVERRTVTAATQAAATGAIAFSRAQLLAQAQRAASTDGLTGLNNRRTFDETMRRHLATWSDSGEPFALVLADVDHFKSVNDRFGHQVGDEVLQAVARVFATVALPHEIPARYGGEEFALIVPGADTATAAQSAERLRLALLRIEQPVRVSASFGVGSVPADAHSVDSLILAADAALLQAKAGGRNRVLVAGGSAATMPATTG
jgi:two-component system, cell cycle response regulator